MNIGIYVTTMMPNSAAQAHFQGSLFQGLRKLDAPRYHFMVFTQEAADGLISAGNISYHILERDSNWDRIRYFFRIRVGRILQVLCSLLGMRENSLSGFIRRWMNFQPRYYKQLLELDVRLLWNMNQHELRTPLPYIRTIWDVNHRIHSMYP